MNEGFVIALSSFVEGQKSGVSTFIAEQVKRSHLRAADPFVVEIGSNDGIMLRHFARAGHRHLGIEPSANVAAAARVRAAIP